MTQVIIYSRHHIFTTAKFLFCKAASESFFGTLVLLGSESNHRVWGSQFGCTPFSEIWIGNLLNQ